MSKELNDYSKLNILTFDFCKWAYVFKQNSKSKNVCVNKTAVIVQLYTKMKKKISNCIEK